MNVQEQRHGSVIQGRRRALSRLLVGLSVAATYPAFGADPLSGLSAAESVLYSFGGGPNDGAEPYARLFQGSNGDFYGTTRTGGIANGPSGTCYGGCGTIFRMTPAGVETVLHPFNSSTTDGSSPQAGLIQGSTGNFYGTAPLGGTLGHGVVFEITPAGDYTTLHSFDASDDGSGPFASLIKGSDGNFYSTTQSGGAGNSFGTVFRLTPGGVETILHNFAGGSSDGNSPLAPLVQGSDGNFYGTTYSAGSNPNGTVFRITPDGTETVLHVFSGKPADGAHPRTGLIQGSDGNFYGTTYEGGTKDLGTVFKITPAGEETVLHAFAGTPTDASRPSELIEVGGVFYGAGLNGANGYGAIFAITPAGAETLVYSFGGSTMDGHSPVGGLIQASDGDLYGTTSQGGANDKGTVFKLSLQHSASTGGGGGGALSFGLLAVLGCLAVLSLSRRRRVH